MDGRPRSMRRLPAISNLLKRKKGTAMRRVIRAFQVEYKNSRKRNSRLVDDPLRLETVASVFGDSGRTGVAKAQPSEQAAKNVRQ
jgi:hypothetical protein